MNLATILSVAIPSIIALIGVVLANWWLRRSQREANKNTATANDTNAFQVVTDQLFKLNGELASKLDAVEKKVKTLEDAVAAKDQKIETLEEELEQTDGQLRRQMDIARQLANYIKLLITRWPANAGPPPAPDPPIDWERLLHD